MAQVNYITEGGDTLPSVAEKCGHSGEWQAILEVNTWIPEGGDYLNVPPGSTVLLPMDWMPAGAEAAEAGTRSRVEQAADAAEAFEGRHRGRS